MPPDPEEVITERTHEESDSGTSREDCVSVSVSVSVCVSMCVSLPARMRFLQGIVKAYWVEW